MDKFILKNKFSSDFYLKSFENATKVRVPRREAGDFLIDGSKVYKKEEFYKKYTVKDFQAMRVAGRHQYTTEVV